MTKEMRFEMNPLSFHKQNHVFVKFAVSFLLLGLAFRLFVSDSIRLSSVVEETLLPEKAESPEVSLPALTPVSADFPGKENQTSQNVAVKCDIFTGDWIPDPSGPIYTNGSCHVMEDHQNCMSNGRSDSGYLYWRWNPRECELPRFDAQKFLEFMRNKSWAFIGDSISRNHVQSLLCILSQT